MCRSGRVQSGLCLPSRVGVQFSNNGRVRVVHLRHFSGLHGFGSHFQIKYGSRSVLCSTFTGLFGFGYEFLDPWRPLIHTTPVYQLTSCEAKSCMFVRNKFIMKPFLTSNNCFQLKYKSSMHNIAFSSENLIWIRKEICTDQAPFTSENGPKQFYKWCNAKFGWRNNLIYILDGWRMSQFFSKFSFWSELKREKSKISVYI